MSGQSGETLAAAERVLAQVREAQLQLAAAQVAAERVNGAQLPEPVRERLRRDWAFDSRRWATVEEYTRALEAAVAAEVELMGSLRELFGGQGAGLGREGAGSGLVTGYGAPAVRVEVSAVDKQRAAVQVALDRLFGVRESEDDADVQAARRLGVYASIPQWRFIREAYTAITGDALVTGTVQPALSIVREANEVTTAVMNQALLNSMTKRLVQDYAGQPQEWRRFCTVRSIKDFKQQDRVRLHDFAALSTVGEIGAYTNLAWDDAREIYTPAKRGNVVQVSREAILNDDLDAVRKIPAKLAIAAGITINEFVYTTLIAGNPTLNSDSLAVYHATHANTDVLALNSTNLQAAIVAMMKQTNAAGKRLNLRPRYLLVPPDLWFTAQVLVNSTMVPGSANNDANVLRGIVEPISVAQFTDANDWYLFADPNLVESIEVGFVGGREVPELLVQDQPLTGSVFTNDAISYKIRWEFGGGWVDYRGTYRNVVP